MVTMKRMLLSLALVLLAGTSFLQAQQPINNAQVAGTATSTAASGVQKVGIVGSTGTAFDSTAGVMDENVKNIAGSAVSTAATGVQKVGIVGNAGSTMDVAQGGGTAATDAMQTAGVFNTSLPTLTNGQGGAVQLDAKGQQLVDINYVAGSAVATAATGIIKVGLTDGSGNAINSTSNALNVNFAAGNTISLVPKTTGGLTVNHFVAAASDNATNVKGSAGQVYQVNVFNNAAYPIYVKLYNKATSPTSCGATSLFKVFGVQAGTQAHFAEENGWAMGTGIGYCVVKGITDADDTSVLISDATVDISWI